MGKPQKDAFAKVKKLITTAPTLAYFDVTKPTIVSADSNSYGIGAVLLQLHGNTLKPVVYASRSLLPSGKNYAQIEKECLASVWACEKFHRYLYGLPSFKLITDHKPDPLLDSCDLNSVPLRCQRLIMRLMKYSPKGEFAPGKSLVIADTLSRLPVAVDNKDSAVEMISYVEVTRRCCS